MLRVHKNSATQVSVCDSSSDVRNGLLRDDFFRGECVYRNASGLVN